MIQTNMKNLLAILLLSIHVTGMAQDGMALTRGTFENYTLDDAIIHGKDVFVVRWLSVKKANFGPLGASGYDGKIQVVHRLYGDCPAELDCSFRIWTVPEPGVTWKVPDPADICLMMGSYYTDQQRMHARRFIAPTQANLELIGSLIHQFKAKELAADTKAAAMLEQNLTLALAEAKAREQALKKAEEPETAFDSRLIWAGISVALLVLVCLLLRKKG
jgi:hypothetical protein